MIICIFGTDIVEMLSVVQIIARGQTMDTITRPQGNRWLNAAKILALDQRSSEGSHYSVAKLKIGTRPDENSSHQSSVGHGG